MGPLVARSDSERAARQAHLQYAEADFDPLSFDATAARAFGQVAASLRALGRTSSDRSYDAMTAATAIAHGIPLYTFNPRDFEGINDLTRRCPAASRAGIRPRRIRVNWAAVVPVKGNPGAKSRFNPRDFEGINDLTVVALPHPGPGSVLAESA